MFDDVLIICLRKLYIFNIKLISVSFIGRAEEQFQFMQIPDVIILLLSQQWTHYDSLWNLFKVKKEATRKILMA